MALEKNQKDEGHIMANIQQFQFHSHSVRTVLVKGEPWFVANDISSALLYRDSRDLVRILDEDEKGTHTVRTLGGPQEVLIINESGLYHALFKSRKPIAQKFRKWVTSEVLPSIRKTGGYMADLPMLSDHDRAKLKTAANNFIDLFGGIKNPKEASMLVAYISRSANEYSYQEGREALMGFRLKEVVGLNHNPRTAIYRHGFEYSIKKISQEDFDWISSKLSLIDTRT